MIIHREKRQRRDAWGRSWDKMTVKPHGSQDKQRWLPVLMPGLLRTVCVCLILARCYTTLIRAVCLACVLVYSYMHALLQLSREACHFG